MKALASERDKPCVCVIFFRVVGFIKNKEVDIIDRYE